jgi:hypothetical protein
MGASHWVAKPKGAMKVKTGFSQLICDLRLAGAQHSPSLSALPVARRQRSCWDPKEAELCVISAKPEETLVEACRGSDVQIDLQNCAKGRKTNRSF